MPLYFELEEHISEHPENALDQHEASDVQANQSPAVFLHTFKISKYNSDKKYRKRKK